MGVSAATDILVLSGVSLSLAGKAKTSQCDTSLPEPNEPQRLRRRICLPRTKLGSIGLTRGWGTSRMVTAWSSFKCLAGQIPAARLQVLLFGTDFHHSMLEL